MSNGSAATCGESGEIRNFCYIPSMVARFLALGFVVAACGCGSDSFATAGGDASTGDASGGDAANADGGDLTGDAGAKDGSAQAVSRIVFVTAATLASNFGGAPQADMACTNAAKAAGLHGANGNGYKAWLSTSQTDAATRLNHSLLPYKLVDGTVVAGNWTQLTSGTLLHAIDLTETGATASQTSITSCAGNGAWVWTGTKPDGSQASGGNASQYCNDWSALDVQAQVGSATATSSEWTQSSCMAPCGATKAGLYCIEQ